jgi:hypothetical protein
VNSSCPAPGGRIADGAGLRSNAEITQADEELPAPRPDLLAAHQRRTGADSAIFGRGFRRCRIDRGYRLFFAISTWFVLVAEPKSCRPAGASMFHDPDFTPFTPSERPSWRAAKRNFLENWPPAAYREHYFTLDGVWPFVGRTHYLTDPELIEDMLITRATVYARLHHSRRAVVRHQPRCAVLCRSADWKWQRRALARLPTRQSSGPRRHSSIVPKPRRRHGAPRLTLRQST